MLTWILDDCGFDPGFLIGGVPKNFDVSARLGGSDFFIVEADEYDSAFFDKRSKFVHYHGRTVILNNLEFDHADIFSDIEAIKTQFHHLIRTIPEQGLIVYPDCETHIKNTLSMGCWTPTTVVGKNWQANLLDNAGSKFEVLHDGQIVGHISWLQTGAHNVNNALSAIAAAYHVGVLPKDSIDALNRFEGVRRRMELISQSANIDIFDDFAHHPTAIKSTLEGLKKSNRYTNIWAVIEPRSNTMRMGVHKQALSQCGSDADQVIWYQPKGLDWGLADVIQASEHNACMFEDIESIIVHLVEHAGSGDAIVLMSNGGFQGIHQKLVNAIDLTN